MRYKTKYFLLIFAIIILGCKDEFLLETTNYKPIMVVDGMITNEPGPYTIKLSLDSPLPLEEEVCLKNCTVSLYENTDKSEVLTETEPGVYVTSTDGIQGIVGNNYSISIITPDGKEYNTEPQEMKEPIEIDSIYVEFMYLADENYVYGLPGYKFYTTTKVAPNQDSYILWNMYETYRYNPDYPLWATMTENGLQIAGIDTSSRFEDVYWCWKTQNTGYMFTGKTSNLTIPKLSNQPLNFVGTDSKRLQLRYSLLLMQYSIGKEAYYYWKSIEDQISQENFLVVSQPYNITGNIKNINNHDESVYGYFTVATATQKRTFVNRPPEVDFYFEKCYVCYTPPCTQFWVLSDIGRYGTVQSDCLDCTSEGGEVTRPDFWIDK
ncbi:MAG: DUF4249 family protein [Bacteroidales bacterium]|nr:DUF4249 family protein [Bacteroidales bacterium]